MVLTTDTVESIMFWVDIIIKVALSACIAGLLYYLDHRRRIQAADEHMGVIRYNVTKLHDIYAQMALDVEEIYKDEETVSADLVQYMIRYTPSIERAIDNIETRSIQRTGMSQVEKAGIDQIVESARAILDTYHRLDVPEENRSNLWRNLDAFHANHRKIVKAARQIGAE